MGLSSGTGDQPLGNAAEPARIHGFGVEGQEAVGAGQQAHQDHRNLGVLLVMLEPIGQTVEQDGELGDDLGVEGGEPAAELRAPQGGDADLGEEHAPDAIGRHLEKEEIEGPAERALGIEHVELGLEGCAQILHHLIDAGDEEVLLGGEVVVYQPRRHAGLLGEALHRGLGEPVLHDRGPEPVDDLPAARLGETRTSHRLIG